MDLIDRKILTALQQDAAISHADLAAKVGTSSASCWRRIKALEDALAHIMSHKGVWAATGSQILDAWQPQAA